MNRNGIKGTRFAINWTTHPNNLLRNFCSLMEHQSLVDVVICCGNNSIQAHKFVLAANSPLFREEFEKNPSIEQIMVGGCEFPVLKSVVEMMYCGQTIITEDNLKFLVAIVKLFQMKHLESLFADQTASPSDDVYLPKPQFLTKKPKYPAFTYQLPPASSCNIVAAATAQPITNIAGQFTIPTALPSGSNILKPLDFNVAGSEAMVAGTPFKSFARGKRTLKQQAEQACVKEAQASRMALASLQKEIAAAPQVNSFVIEDTCTETTVENFIPHAEAPPPYVLNFNDISESLQNSMFMPVGVNNNNPGSFGSLANPMAHADQRALMADKLKYILGTNQVTSNNVEIMYKDAEGNFVPINEEVLQNLSTKEGIQYQVVDEEGRVSEMQELQVLDKIMDTGAEMIEFRKPALEVGDFLKDTESTLSVKDGLCSIISKTGQETIIPSPSDPCQTIMELPSLEENCSSKSGSEVELKFSADMFFANIEPAVAEDDIFCETAHKIEKIDR